MPTNFTPPDPATVTHLLLDGGGGWETIIYGSLHFYIDHPNVSDTDLDWLRFRAEVPDTLGANDTGILDGPKSTILATRSTS